MVRKTISFSLLLLFSGAVLSCGGGPGVTQAKISKDKKLYIGAVPFEPPLLYQQGMEMVGPEAQLAAKLAEAFGEKMGLELEPFWISRSYNTLTAALANQEVDFIISVFGINEERREQIAFSEPYYTSELVLIVNPVHKPDLRPNTLDGQKIGVREGTTIQRRVTAKFPNSEIVTIETADEAILALKRGEIDGVVGDKNIAAFVLGTVPGAAHLEIVPGVIDTIDCAVGVRKNDGVLQWVNEVIAQVKSEGLHENWIQEHLGNHLAAVTKRHTNRLDRDQKAEKPRRVQFRVTKDQGNSFDIYRFANLSFTLTNTESGKAFTTSKIDFQGRTGVSSVSVPPGNYRVYLQKFNFSPGSVQLIESDPDQITVTIRLQANGNIVMRRS